MCVRVLVKGNLYPVLSHVTQPMIVEESEPVSSASLATFSYIGVVSCLFALSCSQSTVLNDLTILMSNKHLLHHVFDIRPALPHPSAVWVACLLTATAPCSDTQASILSLLVTSHHHKHRHLYIITGSDRKISLT